MFIFCRSLHPGSSKDLLLQLEDEEAFDALVDLRCRVA